MKQLHHALTLTTLALLATAACTKETTLPERTETEISSTGGTALSAAGELTLQIPAGAVPDGTRVIITTDRGAHPANVVGPVFDLDTEPRVSRFSPAIRVELKNPQRDRAVQLANLDGATPVAVTDASYDSATATARGALEHFSRYGLVTTTSTPSCPESATPNSACSDEGLSCQFGQECCCGACYPSLSCTCGGGTWACAATDACLGAPIGCNTPDAGTLPDASVIPDAGVIPDGGTSTSTGCPVDETAAFGASCSDPSLACSYGVQTCCGQTFPSIFCSCDGTSFGCRPTDACLAFPTCLPVFPEVEPNDRRDTPNSTPVPVTVHGMIGHQDTDTFQFVLTSTAARLRVRTHTDPLDPTACAGLDTVMVVSTADFSWFSYVDGGESPPCASIDEPVTGGSYIVQVWTSTQAAPVPTQPYYLTVEVE